MLLMLWGVPRSRSTAFFRMMIERGDFTTVHEPFSYLASFGRTEIGGKSTDTVSAVLAELRALAAEGPVFVKETTDRRYPEVLADRSFLAEDAQHTFLIRHPRDTIASYLAIRPEASLHEIGFEAQYELYQEVRSLTGREPVVMDADELTGRPVEMVEAYCAHVGIEFRPRALTWQPSDRPEWRPMRRWHAEAAASSGWNASQWSRSRETERHPMFETCLEYHLPFYEELRRRRLVVLRGDL
ncbi:sulfotransferase-like domain-containing protein [Salininema proteolyticum]|uniref:Sulfotransferase family protein n=1 Tax=Salininema proteolyticum TaxID=1607685 RepID=A0ABV8TXC3_9ACTN